MIKRPKFKKGSKVEVVAYPEKVSQLIGKKGIVTGQDDLFVAVKIESRPDTFYFFTDELKKIKEAK